MFNYGGQQRTIQSTCGFTIKGHPQEVNKKIIRHRRYCNICRIAIENSLTEENVIPPAFNKVSGMINGWNGMLGDRKTQQMVTTAIIDGRSTDIVLDANCVEQAMDEIALIQNYIDDATEPILDFTELGARKPKMTNKRKGKKGKK
jgi:hypothetical protein